MALKNKISMILEQIFANFLHNSKFFFFSRTKIKTLADQKWSADRTLGNTGLTTEKHQKKFANQIIIFFN